jgi:hypothetical protein
MASTPQLPQPAGVFYCEAIRPWGPTDPGCRSVGPGAFGGACVRPGQDDANGRTGGLEAPDPAMRLGRG